MKTRSISIGVVIGLIASAIGLVLTLLIFGEGNSLSNSLQVAIDSDVLTKLVSMGAILNLAVFFLFLKRNEDSKARGVLIATIIVAIITIIVRFV